MTDRELMQQVLEALEGWNHVLEPKPDAELISALRSRLAQPEQCQCPECQITPHASDCAVHNEPAYPKGACNCGAQPEQEPYQTQLERFAALVADAERERIIAANKPEIERINKYIKALEDNIRARSKE